jgi:cytidine deaminase
MAENISDDQLVNAAAAARENALASYSGFRVGAAVETDAGEIISGCNIETSTYGLTLCAERVAIFKAVSEAKRKFRRIAVVADTERLTPPCGSCRQIIWELCGDVPVVMTNLAGKTETIQMRDLLPNAFDSDFFR